MKVVAVVPMKLNNERLANKNTKKFSNGKPLCSYIVKTLSKVKNIDEIFVFCSDESIKEYINENVTFLKRSKNLDTNKTTMNDVLNSFVSKVDADVYVLAHTTAPFVSAKAFEESIRKVTNDNFDSAFSVKRVKEFLWKDSRPLNYELTNIPRTQDLPLIYSETCGFYIFKKEVLVNSNRRIGDNPFLYEIDNIEAIDIDDEFDFKIADYLTTLYEKNEDIER